MASHAQEVPRGLLFEKDQARDLTWIVQDALNGGSSPAHPPTEGDVSINNNKGSTATSRKIHPIHNIYKENASIRRTMEDLENSMPYYQTGIRGDPDFMVQYKNHPFDKLRMEREGIVRDNNGEFLCIVCLNDCVLGGELVETCVCVTFQES